MKKKVLIIRIDNIGDFILFSPALKYYKKIYQNYSITILVKDINKGLAERFNSIDKIITFDKKKYNNNLFYRRKLLLKLIKGNFEIAIYPTYSREPLGDYFIKIINTKEKIGFYGNLCNISEKQKQKNNKYYTKLIKIKSDIIIEVEKNKYFIESFGIKINKYLPFFTPSAKDYKKANEILFQCGFKKNNKCVIICPGSSFTQKNWPIDKFAKLINWLKKEKGVEVIVCGSKNEKFLVAEIEKKTQFHFINIVGLTSIPVLSAIIKKCVVYIGNDTGTTHLASAVRIPTICIIGGGHFGRFFPYGNLNKIIYHKMPCFDCNWKCKYNSIRCIENISVKQVIQKINETI